MQNSEFQYRKFVKTLLLTLFGIVLSVGVFNFIMDPMWTFSHAHYFNSRQKGFDERQQKTNLAYFRNFDYNAVLMGSSRATLLDQNVLNLNDIKAFNYAISLSMPQEYKTYIDFAKQRAGKPLEAIFLELDFYGTNKNNKRLKEYKQDRAVQKAKACCYRWKMLFSFSTLKMSLNNLARAILGKNFHRSYNRYNVAYTDRYAPESVKKEVEKTTLKNAVGMENYAYNEKYRTIFEQLKSENPGSRFIVFTSPTSSFYLDLLFKNGLWDAYANWLRDLVAEFGSVYHFMDYNTITLDYPKYFLDYHHVYPNIQNMMAKKVIGMNDPEIPADFGTVLTKENIDNYLKMLKKRIEKREISITKEEERH
ncbi:MAG: hypothetical protein B6D59_02420 [Campylobacteraceae bacterium 4484_4]|nr:MAG: hypothetical protein B6D59_02420 [Campylobacteraceae bacterium 4484_4]